MRFTQSPSCPFGRWVPLFLALLAVACSDDSTAPKPIGPPARMEIVSGEGQTAVVGHELPIPLIVDVFDGSGRAVSGQLISFVVTSGNGSLFVPAGITDASGRVQNRWTLGTNASDAQKVEARAIDNSTGEKLVFAEFSAAATPDAPASLTKLVGDLQTGIAGHQLAELLTVKVADQYGNGVSGITVTWTPSVGGGSLGAPSSVTSASGLASATLSLGGSAGANAVTASVNGLPSVSFTATGTAGAAASLAAVSGDGQRSAVGTVLADPLVVRLADVNGNPVAGATITWTVLAGGGTVTPTSVTATDGRAAATLTLGTAAGSNTVRAAAPGVSPVTFTATGAAGTATSLTKVSGDAQTGPQGNVLPQRLVVRVDDQYGNPVPGATIAWATTVGNGSLSAASTLSDDNGRASVEWVLGALGTNQATARTGSLQQVTFTATSTTANAASWSIVSGDAQTGTVKTALSAPLVVRALDANGNARSGVVVQFVTHNPGAVTSPPTVSTDASGYATTQWTLGPTAGSQSVTATASGMPTLTFTATARPDVPATITKVSGDGQSAAPGSVLTLPLVAEVRDRFGNAVPGAVVGFVVSNGSGTVTPSTATADPGGRVSAQFTLGSTNWNTVTASVSGLAPVIFNALPASFSTVAVGSNSCGLTSDAVLYCWGTNRFGELGAGAWDTLVHPRPVHAGGPDLYRSVNIGGLVACGITLSNESKCWGMNSEGQIGSPGFQLCWADSHCAFAPVAVSGGINFKTVRPGSFHTCALTQAGEAYCWGRGSRGGLGDGSRVNFVTSPVRVSGGLTFADIGVGNDTFSCGLTTAGAIYCWGRRAAGWLGTLAPEETCTAAGVPFACNTTPVPVASSETFVSLSVGNSSSCGITVNGATLCWGSNSAGQLGQPGNGTNQDTSAVPIPVSGGHSFLAVTVGTHACGLTAAGEVYCWGSNDHGALGIGVSDQQRHPTPTRVAGTLTFSAIQVGNATTCALATDGGTYCWGYNGGGEVGDGTVIDRFQPTLVVRP